MSRCREFIALSGARRAGWMTEDEVRTAIEGTRLEMSQGGSVYSLDNLERERVTPVVVLVANEPNFEVRMWSRSHLDDMLAGRETPAVVRRRAAWRATASARKSAATRAAYPVAREVGI